MTTMLPRRTLAVCLMALGVALAAGPNAARAQQTEPPAAASTPPTPDAWVARFEEAKRTGQVGQVARELAAYPAAATLTTIRAMWPGLSVDAKQQLLKSLVVPGTRDPRPAHPQVFELLHLGWTDANSGVREWTRMFAGMWAFRDFTRSEMSVDQWLTEQMGQPPLQALRVNAIRYAAELSIKFPTNRLEAMEPLQASMRLVQAYPEARQGLIEGGLLEVWAQWLTDITSDETTIKTVLEMVPVIGPSPVFYDRWVYPLMERTRPAPIRFAAVLSVAYPGNTWATPIITRLLLNTLSAESEFKDMLWVLAAACARIDDKSTIPTLIGIIAADNSYHSTYGVGHFGLAPLTGVAYDESHDAAWWKKWWEEHRATLPEDVSTLEIPTLSKSSDQAAPAAASATQVSVRELLAGDDEKKRYFLIGPPEAAAAPEEGWGLLVVLPGGDGSEEFRTFVTSIAARGVPTGFVVAQAVAPKWRDDENRIVWPTSRLPDDQMKFATEAFIGDIIADAGTRVKINPDRVFGLGWSSGGPPIYTAALSEGSALRGAVVAMSVYKPELLPPRSGAKGKAFRILHSEQDFIPIRMARQAVEDLRRAGAAADITTYEGGHGWHGDAAAMIRSSVEWLEQHASKAR